MYKKGGKKPKSSFIEKSKEIKFGDGGLYSKAEQSENIARVKKMNSEKDFDHQTQVKKKTGGPDDPPTTPAPAAKSTDSGSSDFYSLAKLSAQSSPRNARKALKEARKVEVAKATGTRAGGKLGETLTGAGAALTGAANVVSAAKSGPAKEKTGGKRKGGKSMEPGGGGRFAALVGKLKSKGKSTESAKAIAASIGRSKYGKSKFQEMAAKGKKGLGGASDSTSSNEAGMEMMEGMKKKRSERVGARAEKVMNKAKANWQKAEAIVKFDKTKEFQNMAGDRFGRIATDKANQLYAKAARQEKRAKRIKERSEFLKAAGKRMGGKKC